VGLKLSDFQYDLPEGMIAKYPAKPRDASRLLAVPPDGPFEHTRFRALPSFLAEGDLLVVNDTRVVQARLLGRRAGGGEAEVFLLRPAEQMANQRTNESTNQRKKESQEPPFEKGGPAKGSDSGQKGSISPENLPLSPSFARRGDPEPPFEKGGPAKGSDSAQGGFLSGIAGGEELWEALVRPGRRLRKGARVSLGGDGTGVEVVGECGTGRRLVRAVGATFPELMARHGSVPLPPYIHREPEEADARRYQTVYARAGVSVAAPTAGLHFTPRVLGELEARGVREVRVRLDVGPGTFKPVTLEEVDRHQMDPEAYFISEGAAEALNAALSGGRRLVAVGTTVTRTLEDQLRRFGEVRPGAYETDLFIRPGFRFRAVSALLTNFHLPGSTLLMLVSAFAGRERVLEAYREAVRLRYRFYSYGDAMFLWRD
jgi:S-adenosylmethionine:tRNA ribosyltransferase-isomerase